MGSKKEARHLLRDDRLYGMSGRMVRLVCSELKGRRGCLGLEWRKRTSEKVCLIGHLVRRGASGEGWEEHSMLRNSMSRSSRPAVCGQPGQPGVVMARVGD